MTPPDLTDHLRTMSHDLQPLSDHASFLSQKVNFLLDATLGLINIEQNAIIKIFSIGAVIFLPPTLIASYFGMNFQHMGIFEWYWGEWIALIAMALSVIGALWYFKKRGWF